MFVLRLGAAAAVTLCLVQCSAEQGADDSSEPALEPSPWAVRRARVWFERRLQDRQPRLQRSEHLVLPARCATPMCMEARYLQCQLSLHRTRCSALYTLRRRRQRSDLHAGQLDRRGLEFLHCDARLYPLGVTCRKRPPSQPETRPSRHPNGSVVTCIESDFAPARRSPKIRAAASLASVPWTAAQSQFRPRGRCGLGNATSGCARCGRRPRRRRADGAARDSAFRDSAVRLHPRSRNDHRLARIPRDERPPVRADRASAVILRLQTRAVSWPERPC